MLADAERLGNLLVRQTLRQGLEHFQLAGGEGIVERFNRAFFRAARA